MPSGTIATTMRGSARGSVASELSGSPRRTGSVGVVVIAEVIKRTFCHGRSLSRPRVLRTVYFGSRLDATAPTSDTEADNMKTGVNEPDRSAIAPPICGEIICVTPKARVAALKAGP